MSSVPVYVGRWRDYSQKSRILGDVITLDVRGANILISTLSIFVGLVGNYAFSLAALIIHRFLMKRHRQSDALAVQLRVLFRDPGSALDAIEDLNKLLWAWFHPSARQSQVKPLKRRSLVLILVLALPPAIFFVGFTAAGVLVSNVAGESYRSNNVRTLPVNCGSFVWEDTPEGRRALQQKIIDDTLASRAYVDSCYGEKRSIVQCSLYPVQAITYNTTQVPCPFGIDESGKSFCLFTQSQALQIDTGLMDTNDILGINAALENRILFRKRFTCSPINVTSYIEMDNSTKPFRLLNLGPFYNVSTYTYRYNTEIRSGGLGYIVSSIRSAFQSWTPIEPLQVFDGDVSIIILNSNSVAYLAPVEDPWFFAHTPFDLGTAVSPEYVADSDISVMGCVERLQICNPITTPFSCTVISNILDIIQAYTSIGLNDLQEATASRLIDVFITTAIDESINALGDNALLARRSLYEVISTGLPANQWQIEARGWFEISLAKLQAAVIEQVTRTSDLSPFGKLEPPNPNGDFFDRAASIYCKNQRVRNTGGYQTFSFLGLMVIVCVGLTIILTSVFIERVLRYFARRSSKVRKDKDDVIFDPEAVRTADGKFQLLKMALWGAGYKEGWESVLEDVPVTTAEQGYRLPSREPRGGIQGYWYVRDQEMSSPPPREPIEEAANGELSDTTAGDGLELENQEGSRDRHEDGNGLELEDHERNRDGHEDGHGDAHDDGHGDGEERVDDNTNAETSSEHPIGAANGNTESYAGAEE